MGDDGDDRHGGGERWRDRDHDQNWNRDRGQGREQGRGSYGYGSGGGNDRGFIDRAGDELRSWFGDDDAQRRREMDQRRWEQEQRMTGRRDNDSGPGTLGGGGFGTGWGNQAGESWNRERPGTRGWAGGSRDQEGYERGSRGGEGRESGGRYHGGGGEREGWFSDSVGGERGQRQGGPGGGYGGGSYGGRSSGSSASGGFAASGGQSGGDIHDPHYSEWRRRQIEDLDRDYDEYRREHQSKFETEFGSWRTRRQGQRQSVGKAMPHMEVVGSDGIHVGTVDKVAGDRIILTRSDANAGGIHHSVPCSWIETVDDKVTLNKSAEDAMTEWRNEERGRALFERDNPRGGEGPHVLDRSFSGSYGDGNRERDRDRGTDPDPDRSGGRGDPQA